MIRQAGNATLYAGDASDVLPLLRDVDLIIADPPYGARRPSDRRQSDERFDEVHGNDAVHTDWLQAAFTALRDGGALYLFACWDRMELWRVGMQGAGFTVRSCIVWDKGVHGLADLETCWAPQHELILFAAKGRHLLVGKRPKDVIVSLRVPAADLVHPYQKPVAVCRRLIAASSRPGDVVCDPFMGSGSTGVGAVEMGRRFVGVEIGEEYFALACQRIDDAQRQQSLFEVRE